ncbi:hypothetical protein [Dehalococcoides mccartyi]|uniref:Uncharacterized protein n=1 Tax=Dehalococcoides mccartyi (strain VS) TaxID=311424 RepID=D2BGE3_DEHMV|nr:hypothetical protein [Dehalococcoides mccartyi]ACZ61393.1 hypothetical protein DhcVS_231 [Dehalococcoides mccartyi VS]
MPGEFYIEGKAAKVSLKGLEDVLARIETKVDGVKSQTDKLAGETPGEGSTTADWQSVESDVVLIGAAGIRNKIHDLTVSIRNLMGSQITVRLYKAINGIEQEVYKQNFDAAIDPPGLPVINGSWAMHGILRVTLQSNDVADNGKAVDYDYMLEAI